MKRFLLNRLVDVSGTSGMGIIAEGCMLPNAKCIIQWHGKYNSLFIWYNIDSCLHINGHGGNTIVEWIDK